MTKHYSKKSGGKKARSDTSNKKVRNVKPIFYDGIQFKSTLECTFYKEACKEGLIVTYEPETVEIFPTFNCNVPFYTKDGKGNLVLKSSKVQHITYTIDFQVRLDVGDNKYIVVETKGKENDAFRNINKLYRNLISNSGEQILGHFKLHNKTQILQALPIIKLLLQ